VPFKYTTCSATAWKRDGYTFESGPSLYSGEGAVQVLNPVQLTGSLKASWFQPLAFKWVNLYSGEGAVQVLNPVQLTGSLKASWFQPLAFKWVNLCRYTAA
jgi:hypothetical protein